MKKTKSILLICTTILMGICLVIGGCNTAAQKPAEGLPDTPVTPPNTRAKQAYPQEKASRVATEASKTEGVNDATAVVSGRVIYVGLDLNANLDKEESAKIEQNVSNQVKNMESGYTVMVTSDIDTVTRIRNIGKGIAQGQPLSTFKNEFENINTRLSPNK